MSGKGKLSKADAVTYAFYIVAVISLGFFLMYTAGKVYIGSNSNPSTTSKANPDYVFVIETEVVATATVKR